MRAPDSSHPLQEEHSARRTVSMGTITDRVDAFYGGLSDPLPPVAAHCGLVRDEVQQPSTPVCVPLSRSVGCGSGCSVTSVGVSERAVCLSTVATSTCLAPADPRLRGTVHPGHSACVVTPAVVLRPPGVGGVTSSSLTSTTRPSGSGSMDAPEPSSVPTSRMALIQSGYVARGFSPSVATHLAHTVRLSSSSVYDAKWVLYESWCREKGTDPLRPSPQQVSEFLCHLFQEVKLAASTLRAYKASILSVLTAHTPMLPADSDVLSTLLRSFHRLRPPTRTPVPEWDLSFVLASLLRHPYEPLDRAPLDLLTYKTVFLMALATGGRRGELLALMRGPDNVKWSADSSEVHIYSDPSFIPKTRRAFTPGRPISIKSLGNTISSQEPDMKLCPCRALRMYLDRTSLTAIEKGRRKLFLPVNLSNSAELTSQGLSKFFPRLFTVPMLILTLRSSLDSKLIFTRPVSSLTA